MQRILIFCATLLAVSAIHDGSDATKHQFPYVVYVRSPQFYCAGTLISERHVLTAAHCLMSLRKGQKATIILGMHKNGWNRDGLTVTSSQFWVHENFSMPSAVFDIGLVELPKSIHELLNNSRAVKPIKIDPTPNVDLDPSESEAIIAGWGYTARYSPAQNAKYTKMKIISLDECKQYQSHYIETITENHICVMKLQGIPCDGDSGAAMISTKTNKVIGVLSYVKDAENFTDIHYNDCVTDVPVVSTRISSYIDWISAKTGIDFSQPDKSCTGAIVNSTNINNFEGCEIINGDLEINNRTFEGMHPEKLNIFKDVRKITGYLKITANHPDFVDLSYLKNLESIGDGQGERAVKLLIYKTSLKSLGLVSLKRISNGAIFISHNQNLCYVHKIDWRKIQINSTEVYHGHNKKSTKCESDGEVCSSQCFPSGCWGADVNDCLEINANRKIESNEIEDDY